MKMLKTGKLIAAMAIATLALPAMAGSWPPILRKAPGNTTQPAPTKSPAANFWGDGYAREGEGGTWGGKLTATQPTVDTATQPSVDVATANANGFQYIGGESGWQVAQHKYVWTAGHFAHSSECDHAIHTAKAATPAELESARLLYPGA